MTSRSYSKPAFSITRREPVLSGNVKQTSSPMPSESNASRTASQAISVARPRPQSALATAYWTSVSAVPSTTVRHRPPRAAGAPSGRR